MFSFGFMFSFLPPPFILPFSFSFVLPFSFAFTLAFVLCRRRSWKMKVRIGKNADNGLYYSLRGSQSNCQRLWLSSPQLNLHFERLAFYSRFCRRMNYAKESALASLCSFLVHATRIHVIILDTSTAVLRNYFDKTDTLNIIREYIILLS